MLFSSFCKAHWLAVCLGPPKSISTSVKGLITLLRPLSFLPALLWTPKTKISGDSSQEMASMWHYNQAGEMGACGLGPHAALPARMANWFCFFCTFTACGCHWRLCHWWPWMKYSCEKSACPVTHNKDQQSVGHCFQDFANGKNCSHNL
jgi:hypothetical protein